jgi:phosphatidylglycerophosphatase A
MRKALERVSVVVSSGFGSGYACWVPGTCGTLACVALWFATFSFIEARSLFIGVGAAALMILVGTVAVIAATRNRPGSSDPQWIVVDEWAGMLVALIGVYPENLYTVLLAFLLFRLFDMWKPGPIGWAERFPGAYGVMADDVVAGLVALVFVHTSYFLW